MLELAWKELPQSVLKSAWSRILNWDDAHCQLILTIAPNSNLNRDECEEWNEDRSADTDIKTKTGSDESDIETNLKSNPFHIMMQSKASTH